MPEISESNAAAAQAAESNNRERQNPFAAFSDDELKEIVKRWIREELMPNQARLVRSAIQTERRGEALRKDNTTQRLNVEQIVFYLKNPDQWQARIDELAREEKMEMEAAEVYSFKDWYDTREEESKAASAAA